MLGNVTIVKKISKDSTTGCGDRNAISKVAFLSESIAVADFLFHNAAQLSAPATSGRRGLPAPCVFDLPSRIDRCQRFLEDAEKITSYTRLLPVAGPLVVHGFARQVVKVAHLTHRSDPTPLPCFTVQPWFESTS